MNEVQAICSRKGIRLAEGIVETSIQKARGFPFETQTSYQRDVETKGNKNEGDLYGGTIIREGERLNVPTPITQKIYGEIQHRIS